MLEKIQARNLEIGMKINIIHPNPEQREFIEIVDIKLQPGTAS